MKSLRFKGFSLGDVERAIKECSEDDEVCFVFTNRKQEHKAVLINYDRFIELTGKELKVG